MSSEVWKRLERPAACPLTQRRWEVLSGYAMGRSTHQIAKACGITASTVRQLAHHGMQQLGVETRTEAILRVRQGWYSSPRRSPGGEVPLGPVWKAYLAVFDERTREWRDLQLVNRKRAQMHLLLDSELIGNDIAVKRADHRQRQQPSRLKYSLESDILPGL